MMAECIAMCGPYRMWKCNHGSTPWHITKEGSSVVKQFSTKAKASKAWSLIEADVYREGGE